MKVLKIGFILTKGKSLNNFNNYFNNVRYNFESILNTSRNKPNLQFLQLGAYTGDASLWLLDNILTDSSSFLTDVDTWKGSAEHIGMNFNEVENIYDQRISSYKNVKKIKGTTIEYLRIAPLDYYDFIYIDADHSTASTLVNAELSWLNLKVGGLLAFDDYEWNMGKGEWYNPRLGIDIFLNTHQKEYSIIHKDYQVWILKK